MTDGQRGALLSFAYNLGAGFYGGSNFNTITKCLKNKEWVKVPNALYLYRNPGTNVEKGLARRRVAEGKLWSS
jgi:GH24 family phage-related lysozyme (muramidase)